MTNEADTEIYVNGSLLTESETIVVKVALANFLNDLHNMHKWDDNETMRNNHLSCIKRISKKMSRPNAREYHD